jgi:hypothetical protein
VTATPLPSGPITDRERLGWQRRAVRVLAELLERAQRDGLPVVAWSVSPAGAALVARCFAHPPAQRRADFDAWCSVLGASRWSERTSGSTVHLYAVAKNYDGLVDVAVLADLDDQHETPSSTRSEPPRPGGEAS